MNETSNNLRAMVCGAEMVQVAGCDSGSDLFGSTAALQELSTYNPLVEYKGVD